MFIANLDDKGRIIIPRPLRDQLHLAPGALVELEPTGNGFNVRPRANGGQLGLGSPVLKREGSLLVVDGVDRVSLEDTNQAIDAGRDERQNRIADEDIEPS